MMTHAYDRLYLEDAMHNMGTMFDCAIHIAHCDLTLFFEMFLSSGVASQMEVGNPRYVAGLSGPQQNAPPNIGRVGHWPTTSGTLPIRFLLFKAKDWISVQYYPYTPPCTKQISPNLSPTLMLS